MVKPQLPITTLVTPRLTDGVANGSHSSCASKCGIVVPAFRRIRSRISLASFFNFLPQNGTGTVAWGSAWLLSTGFVYFSTIKST